MAKINLDALIPREDFEVEDTSFTPQLSQTIKISDLEKGAFFYTSLRKPDFQRETSDWEAHKITDFIKSFLHGDLIPAIILWNAGRYTFAIDGAHRLSALICWVNDDYGDGFLSQAFFDHEIDEDQKKAAEQTRNLINKKIGTYKDYTESVKNPDKANPEILEYASKLGYLSIQLQWVSGGAEKAEDSFFKINQKAAPIDETEIELLKSRSKPYAMAARAIVRSGTGHKYWSKFEENIREEIEALAKELNESLFIPRINQPIKTLDLPLAGKGYSARTLSLVFDLIKLANNITSHNEVDNDNTGIETLKYLKNVRKIIRRLTTTHPSSLGLHPAVYFYSQRGRYQPTAFLAWIELIKYLEANNSFIEFSKIRSDFEKFVLGSKQLVSQITYKYGSGTKGCRYLKELYLVVIEALTSGKTINQIINDILPNKFSYLDTGRTVTYTGNADFSRQTKSEIFIRESIENAPKCKLCNGLMHKNAITFDHIERREEGGVGNADNGQLAHPYCNSTLKN